MLGVFILRMRLAGKHHLRRTILVIEHAEGPRGIQRENLNALVSGEAAGEAEGQRVLVEAVLGGLDVPAWLIASQPVCDTVDANVLHELGTQRVAHRPQLLIGDVVDAAPGVRIGGARLPSRAEISIEQVAHPRDCPCRYVHAVGDVSDRDGVSRPFGEE